MKFFLLSLALTGASAAAKAAPQKFISVNVKDDAGAPVEDAVVHVLFAKSESFPPEKTPATMDQIDKEFQPHVLPILIGTNVDFPNKDAIHHELYSFSPAKKFELPLYKGKPAQPVHFDKPGVVKLGCNIHDWMSGVILVLDNPYFAKTDATGIARVPIPPGKGELRLAVYHERDKSTEERSVKTVNATQSASVSWKLALKPKVKHEHKSVEY